MVLQAFGLKFGSSSCFAEEQNLLIFTIDYHVIYESLYHGVCQASCRLN
jgi:hypothetical protein